MTTIVEKWVKCPVCGNLVETWEYSSMFVYGQDLDTRRDGGEWYHLHWCSHCNYVSTDFETKITPKIKSIVLSDEYQQIFKQEYPEELPELLGQIYIKEKCHGSTEELGYLYLRVAWLYDDGIFIPLEEREKMEAKEILRIEFSAPRKAFEYRLKSIKYYEKSNKIDSKLILLDLYRRTKQFDKASKLLSEVKFPDKYTHICEQQKRLISEQDDKKHQIEKEK